MIDLDELEEFCVDSLEIMEAEFPLKVLELIQELRLAREVVEKVGKLSTRLRGIDAHCQAYNKCAEYYEKEIKKAVAAYEQMEKG